MNKSGELRRFKKDTNQRNPIDRKAEDPVHMVILNALAAKHPIRTMIQLHGAWLKNAKAKRKPHFCGLILEYPLMSCSV